MTLEGVEIFVCGWGASVASGSLALAEPSNSFDRWTWKRMLRGCVTEIGGVFCS